MVGTHLHIRDHVIWDFVIPEVFCDEAIAVALGHAACPTWQNSQSIDEKKINQ